MLMSSIIVCILFLCLQLCINVFPTWWAFSFSRETVSKTPTTASPATIIHLESKEKKTELPVQKKRQSSRAPTKSNNIRWAAVSRCVYSVNPRPLPCSYNAKLNAPRLRLRCEYIVGRQEKNAPWRSALPSPGSPRQGHLASGALHPSLLHIALQLFAVMRPTASPACPLHAHQSIASSRARRVVPWQILLWICLSAAVSSWEAIA